MVSFLFTRHLVTKYRFLIFKKSCVAPEYSEQSHTISKNMFNFHCRSRCHPASEFLCNFESPIQLMSVSEGTNNFHHSFKSRVVRPPLKQGHVLSLQLTFHLCLQSNFSLSKQIIPPFLNIIKIDLLGSFTMYIVHIMNHIHH